MFEDGEVFVGTVHRCSFQGFEYVVDEPGAMNDQWAEVAAAIRSSEPDQVNDAIDRIKDMDADERARLFDVGFDEVAEIYAESDDGYVRQSVVRVVEQLTPGMTAVVLLADEDHSGGTAVEGMDERVDTACGFLLEAIQDEDGRVRQSAKRGLKEVYRTYDALEDDETLAAIATELEALADEYEAKRRDHLLDSKEDAEFYRSPMGSRLVEGIQRLAERSGDE